MLLPDLPKVLPVLFEAGVVPFLWGAGGIGKTRSIAAAAERMGYGLCTLHLAQQDQADMLGAMSIEKGRTRWAQPDWWPTGKQILFLDEINRCRDDAVYAAARQLISERRLHTHVLPHECHVAAAGNPSGQDFKVVSITDSSDISRYCHLHVTARTEDWLVWAKEAGCHEDVVSHMAMNPNDLLGHEQEFNLNIQPCPRAWEAVSKVMQVEEKRRALHGRGLDAELLNEIVAGLVGGSAARRLAMEGQDVGEVPLAELPSLLKDLSESGRLDEVLALRSRIIEALQESPDSQEAQIALLEALDILPRDVGYSMLRQAMQHDEVSRALDAHRGRLMAWQARK